MRVKAANEPKKPGKFYSGRYVFKITIAIGMMLFAGLPILWLTGRRGFELISSAFPVIIFMVIGSLYYLKYRDTAVTDERDRRDTFKAGTVSWWITWISLIGLLSLKYTNVLNISADSIILLAWFSMPWTWLMFKVILSRIGDVE